MALRTSDADDLRTLDLSVPPLTSLLDEKKYPNNKQTSSSDHPVILRTPPARENEHDPNVDKFASLFTPSAPKSSPTLFPVPQQTSSSSQLQKELSTTEDSGSFISVSAYEDPLSSLLPSSNSSLGVPTNFEWDKDDEELLSTPVLFPVQSPPMSVVPTSSQPPSQPTHSDNASLTFFDKFARNAKRNSEIRRKGLVDELLEFADNPLYFLHNEKEAMQKEGQEDGRNTFGNGEQPTSDPELQTSSPPSLSPDDAILHDLDPGYFSSGRLVNINANSDNDKKPSQRWLSDSPHARSPSLPSPATLAPPIINSIIPLDLHNPSNEASTRSDTSFSRSTSSTFSAKWMSNLLKTSSGGGHHQQQEGHGRTPALASIFGVNADASSSSHPPSRTSPPTAASTVSAIYRRNSSSPFRNHPTPHPQPHVSHTLPTPSTSSSLSTVKHTASPFGAHVYIPPSGAPGFKGDSYDWDKGFSNELEKEIVRGRTGGRVNGKGQRVDVDDGRRMLETNTQAHIRADVGVGIGIGALMEKKSGNLDLKGRRASTTPVLSPNLANLVRYSLFFFEFTAQLRSLFMSSYARISRLSPVFLDLGHWFIHLTNMEYR